jgi:exonuclease SbcD
VMLGQELVLPRSLLKNDVFDYVALGHIHRHQVLDHDPPLVYAGSVDRIDFGEENEAKGFVIAEVERGQSSFQFVELTHTRRFVTIEVTADGVDPMAQVQQAIGAHDIQDAIVRLIIHTTMEKNHLLRDKEINNWLSAAFKVAAVVRDIERVARLRLRSDQAVEKMTALEVLERYLQLRQLSKERVAKLMEYARRIVTKES